QADDLPVRDVDDRLAVLRIAVAGLGVRQRARLEQAAEVAAGEPERLALVEVAAQPDVAVGQREDRLRLREQPQLEVLLRHAPRLDRVLRLLNHRSSPRSATTMLAPCFRSASR